MTTIKVDWNTPPGITIKEKMKEKDITVYQLADHLTRPVGWVEDLLIGKSVITLEIAEKLSKHLDISSESWLKRESEYRKSLNKLKNINKWIKQ